MIKWQMLEMISESATCLQYADDTTAILADTNSAEVLFELLDPGFETFPVSRSIAQKLRLCG